MSHPSIPGLLEKYHGVYTSISFPDEDFPVPLKLITFDQLDNEFIEDILGDALEGYLTQSGDTYKWKSKDITPIAVIGLYSLDYDEENLPSDYEEFQCMGMLFITDSGNILRWDGDHYVNDFRDDCEIIGNVVELTEWISIK